MAAENQKLLYLPDLIESKRVLLLRADSTDPLYIELNRACAEQLDTLLGMGAPDQDSTTQRLLVVRTPFGNLTVLALSGSANGMVASETSKETELLERTLRGLRAERFAYSEKNLGIRAGWLAGALTRLQKERREVDVWKGI